MILEVRVYRRRDYRRLVPWVLTVVFLLWVWGVLWWAVAAAVAVGVGWWVHQGVQAAEARNQALRERADTQHRQTLTGDEHGTYGDGYNTWKKYQEAVAPPEAL